MIVGLPDFQGQHVRLRQVVDVLQAVILQPEDIQVELVALDQLVMIETAEALGLLALVVAANEVFEVGMSQALSLQGLMNVSAVVADPQLSGLGFPEGRELVEEQHVVRQHHVETIAAVAAQVEVYGTQPHDLIDDI